MFSNKPSEQYHHLADQASSVLNRANEQASALAHRGVDSVVNTSKHLRDGALRVSDSTVSYVKDEPVKALLIAAAAGAAVMALISLLGRSRDRR